MRDVKTEHFLDEYKYVWTFAEKMPLAEIDLPEADANPARLGKKLDNDRAFSYAMELEKGVDFPAIVVFDLAKSPLKLVVTGRHRIAAAFAAGLTTFDTYMVREPDPLRRELLTRTINLIEGSAPDAAEKYLQVAEIRRLYPSVTIVELAKRFGLKQDTVETYLRVMDVERRADLLGAGAIISSTKFSQRIKLALAPIKNDHAFIGAIHIVALWPSLRGSAGVDLLARLKNVSSETSARKLLDEAHKEQMALDEDRKVTRTPRTKASKVMGHMRAILRIAGGSVENLHLAGISARNIQEELRVAMNMRILMDDIIKALDYMNTEYERTNEWRRNPHGATSFDTTSPPPA